MSKKLNVRSGSLLAMILGSLAATSHRYSSTGGGRRPYTGEELRAMRARNGVGKPPAKRQARTGADCDE